MCLVSRHRRLSMFFRPIPLAEWAPMQPAAIHPTLDLCTRCPLWLSWPRQWGIHSLSNTTTCDQHWESKPGSPNLESNVLSTWPHAPTNISVCKFRVYKCHTRKRIKVFEYLCLHTREMMNHTLCVWMNCFWNSNNVLLLIIHIKILVCITIPTVLKFSQHIQTLQMAIEFQTFTEPKWVLPYIADSLIHVVRSERGERERERVCEGVSVCVWERERERERQSD